MAEIIIRYGEVGLNEVSKSGGFGEVLAETPDIGLIATMLPEGGKFIRTRNPPAYFQHIGDPPKWHCSMRDLKQAGETFD